VPKKSRKLFRDKRAITPVLSNLLLTVIAVAAMALATTATYVITTNMRENMSERVVAEDVWFTSLPNQINVYLRNVGKVAIHVSAVYINHTAHSSPTFNLELNKHGWLNISYNWLPSSLYYVDVVTSRGTHVGGYYRAP